ncbi:MAG TPA: hypothetical protein H9824_07060 [Candidatus Bacteroides pullicola]|uniref:Uncharacterized protein n=1 Tax=Candidatus Bacteroides pullicola TaxID=2838475 RepID=A0A9D1ZIZ6_9BACE|nr:hypothetical protein [Candidatus Bacteroides pullicola]
MTDEEKEEERDEEKDGILLPAGIVILSAIAILCIAIGQALDVWDHFQQDFSLKTIIDIVLSSLSTLGWGFLDWYLWDEVWEHHKRKKKATTV